MAVISLEQQRPSYFVQILYTLVYFLFDQIPALFSTISTSNRAAPLLVITLNSVADTYVS